MDDVRREANTDEDLVKKRERLERLEAQRASHDLKWLMGDPRGRRFVWALLCEARIFDVAFEPDHHRSYYKAGLRASGTKMYAKLQAEHPDLLSLAQRENT